MPATFQSAFLAVLRRDLLLGMRHRSELANPVIFYLIVVTLFAFAVGSEPAVQRELAPAMIWIAALLASTLSLDSMFRPDFDDGSIEQMLLSHRPLTLLVAAKIAAHWLLNSVPLILTVLVIATLLRLPGSALAPLLATLLLGTPVFSLIGSVLVALTVGLRGSGLLLSLLILPLQIPVLIFSVAAVGNAAQGLPITGELYFLGALLLLSLSIMPPAAAVSLRLRVG